MLCMTGSVRPTCTRLSRCWYLGSHLALEIQLGEDGLQRMTPNRDLARNHVPNGLTEAQYGQTWHLSTQLRCAERTGHRFLWSTSLLLPTLLSEEPGFDLPRHAWSPMNRFWTGQGPCRANLHKWDLAQSPSCDCGQQQTTNHIVDSYPLTKFEGRLNLLHEVDDDAVIWLESTATAALTK